MIPKDKKDYLKNNIKNNLEPLVNGIENYASYGNSYWYKKGSKIHVHIGAKITNSTARINSCFKLPSEIAPSHFIAGTGISEGIQKEVSKIQINTEGYVSVYSSTYYILADMEYDLFKE